MFRRVAAVAAAAMVVTGLATTPASAATITPDQAKAAMIAAVTATRTAAAPGYSMSGKYVVNFGTSTSTGVYRGAINAAQDRAVLVSNGLAEYDYAGHGEWFQFSASGKAYYRGALALLGKPSASFVFRSNVSLNPRDLRWLVESPVTNVSQVAYESVITGASSVANADGSTTYDLTAYYTAGLSSDPYHEVVVIRADGALRSVSWSYHRDSYAYTWGYGTQTITFPVAASYVMGPALDNADYVIQHFTAVVKGRANSVKSVAMSMAKNAGRTRATVADIRAAGRYVAAYFAHNILKSPVAVVPGGTKIYAYNPATRKTVAFTIKLVGSTVVVAAV